MTASSLETFTPLVLLALCLLLGALAVRFAAPPAGMAQGLNWWVINVALPSLVLELIPKLHFEWQFWFLVVTQWATFFGAWVVFSWLGRRLHWSRGRIGALILTCGLGNTSFMGYPMLEALRGKEGLGLGVVADQLGCFTILAVGGITVAALYSGHRPQAAAVLRKIVFFPALPALVIGVVAGRYGGWPPMPDAIFTRLGSTLTPLALFSVGLQFRLHLGRSQLGALGLGLGWKLALAPLLALGFGLLCGIGGLTLKIGVLQVAMAPMISAAILCDQNGLEPPLANTVLGAGILLSLATVPLASFLLG